jgi:hypothetical protein
MLLGDEDGMADAASSLGVRHIPAVERNEYGTPLVNSIIRTAEAEARGDVLCYINADIMLTNAFMRAVEAVHLKKFLMIGRRWDIDREDIPELASANWELLLEKSVAAHGSLHEPTGIDYFVHTRGLWRNVPPFALGRWIWDNWLVFAARASHTPVIDASNLVLAVHQNHTYAHHDGPTESLLDKPEARRNIDLAGGYGYAFTIEDASHILSSRGATRKPVSKKGIKRTIETCPALHPHLNPLLTLLLRAARLAKLHQHTSRSR